MAVRSYELNLRKINCLESEANLHNTFKGNKPQVWDDFDEIGYK